MFQIQNRDREMMQQETQNLFKKIDGIKEVFDRLNDLYGDGDFICFGDDQIDAIEFSAKTNMLSVRICTDEMGQEKKHMDKTIRCVFYIFDFYDVELEYIDIAPEHWIDDIVIQENADGKNSISFGSGGLDFRYSYAKVNRTWIEYEK